MVVPVDNGPAPVRHFFGILNSHDSCGVCVLGVPLPLFWLRLLRIVLAINGEATHTFWTFISLCSVWICLILLHAMPTDILLCSNGDKTVASAFVDNLTFSIRSNPGSFLVSSGNSENSKSCIACGLNMLVNLKILSLSLQFIFISHQLQWQFFFQ